MSLTDPNYDPVTMEAEDTMSNHYYGQTEDQKEMDQ